MNPYFALILGGGVRQGHNLLQT